jgi:undecaprenyl-phosphate galactose phosphotransferase
VRSDGGPAFYFQNRIGKNGKAFKCWKFRSMVTNADQILKEILEKDPVAREEYARDYKLKDDPRITKVGHFLRKSSLDEIPQLYNVLKGEMSLVGPRPVVKAEEVYYGDKFEQYMAVRPGITGLWQVSGRNDVSYDQRVALDVWYVQNWSVWTDLVILFKTTFVVLYRKGAY